LINGLCPEKNNVICIQTTPLYLPIVLVNILAIHCCNISILIFYKTHYKFIVNYTATCNKEFISALFHSFFMSRLKFFFSFLFCDIWEFFYEWSHLPRTWIFFLIYEYFVSLFKISLDKLLRISIEHVRLLILYLRIFFFFCVGCLYDGIIFFMWVKKIWIFSSICILWLVIYFVSYGVEVKNIILVCWDLCKQFCQCKIFSNLRVKLTI